jgi:hypothetical protein
LLWPFDYFGYWKGCTYKNSYLGVEKVCTCKIACLGTKHSMFFWKTMLRLFYLFNENFQYSIPNGPPSLITCPKWLHFVVTICSVNLGLISFKIKWNSILVNHAISFAKASIIVFHMCTFSILTFKHSSCVHIFCPCIFKNPSDFFIYALGSYIVIILLCIFLVDYNLAHHVCHLCLGP